MTEECQIHYSKEMHQITEWMKFIWIYLSTFHCSWSVPRYPVNALVPHGHFIGLQIGEKADTDWKRRKLSEVLKQEFHRGEKSPRTVAKTTSTSFETWNSGAKPKKIVGGCSSLNLPPKNANTIIYHRSLKQCEQ